MSKKNYIVINTAWFGEPPAVKTGGIPGHDTGGVSHLAQNINLKKIRIKFFCKPELVDHYNQEYKRLLPNQPEAVTVHSYIEPFAEPCEQKFGKQKPWKIRVAVEILQHAEFLLKNSRTIDCVTFKDLFSLALISLCGDYFFDTNVYADRFIDTLPQPQGFHCVFTASGVFDWNILYSPKNNPSGVTEIFLRLSRSIRNLQGSYYGNPPITIRYSENHYRYIGTATFAAIFNIKSKEDSLKHSDLCTRIQHKFQLDPLKKPVTATADGAISCFYANDKEHKGHFSVSILGVHKYYFNAHSDSYSGPQPKDYLEVFMGRLFIQPGYEPVLKTVLSHFFREDARRLAKNTLARIKGPHDKKAKEKAFEFCKKIIATLPSKLHHTDIHIEYDSLLTQIAKLSHFQPRRLSHFLNTWNEIMLNPENSFNDSSHSLSEGQSNPNIFMRIYSVSQAKRRDDKIQEKLNHQMSSFNFKRHN